VNANGRLDGKHISDLSLEILGSFTVAVEHSTHFVQAHALLNLHLLHASQVPLQSELAHARSVDSGLGRPENPTPSASQNQAGGFRIYSPLAMTNPHSAASSAGEGEAPGYAAEFEARQLLRAMNRLAGEEGGAERWLSYFGLCREMGVSAVDGMVKGKRLRSFGGEVMLMTVRPQGGYWSCDGRIR
jgi:hypothetical protein